jgi:hypothetical protein
MTGGIPLLSSDALTGVRTGGGDGGAATGLAATATASTGGADGAAFFSGECRPNQRIAAVRNTPAPTMASTDLEIWFFMKNAMPQRVQAVSKRQGLAASVQK